MARLCRLFLLSSSDVIPLPGQIELLDRVVSCHQELGDMPQTQVTTLFLAIKEWKTPETSNYNQLPKNTAPCTRKPLVASWLSFWSFSEAGNVGVCAWLGTSNGWPSTTRLSDRGVRVFQGCWKEGHFARQLVNSPATSITLWYLEGLFCGPKIKVFTLVICVIGVNHESRAIFRSDLSSHSGWDRRERDVYALLLQLLGKKSAALYIFILDAFPLPHE